MKTIHVLVALLLLAGAGAHAAQPAPAPAMPVRADGIKQASIPDHAPLPPEEHGKPFKVIATNWEQRPVIWGWTCELPDGSGLSFGGVNQTTDDGRGHTCVKEGGQWKPIIDDLRKANTLQKQYDAVLVLRNTCKDTLARARSLYFDGKPAADESQRIKSDIDPALVELSAALAKRSTELKGISGGDAYDAEQIKVALKHLDAAAGLIKPFSAQVTPELMATLRQGQVELEIASDAFDAEPPPRALSVVAYDAKTKLFVVFGGDHFDYLMNDLWVFDPARHKWFERHPETAPEPRADHHLDFTGDGRVTLSGGYYRAEGYQHFGPAHWIYDLEKNTWTADGHSAKTVASGIRSAGYAPPGYPESYMKGPRPDAAAFEAKLKAVAPNVWTKLELVNMISRDWGTWVFDADRDLWYVYAGGHASYPGNDVARFHLTTGRWEISDPIELPLGGAGTNEQYPSGVTFNARPWCRRHVWNSQAYEPTLKKMINVGVNDTKLDTGFYVYDPDKAEWTERRRIAEKMNNSCQGMQVRATVHGLLGWIGGDLWLMDAKTVTWKRFETKGQMPGTCVDSCGLVYDPKRDRMLLLTLGDYAKPYDGQIYAVDMKTHDVTKLNPEGMDTTSKSWQMYLREMAYDPTNDLVLITQPLKRGGKAVPDQTLSYDCVKNRWVLIKIAGTTDCGVCSSIAYDAKRNIFWGGEAGYGGGVKVLRFDASKAQITPLKDFVIPAAPVAEKK